VAWRLQQEIERFLYWEAALLDRGEFRTWFDLLADDLRYVMPVRSNLSRPEEFDPSGDWRGAAFFDETKASIHQRLRRLESGQAWAELPPSRTRHLVTNVVVEDTETPGEYRVSSCFLVYRSRLERQVDLFAGTRIDRLRRRERPPGFEIARRFVLLDQATLLANNLSIFF
jgi:3-phenylpropionate/cinnamic acid dioxygenase small subunit